MKKQFIHGEGITGIYVEFNHSEMMVLKAFVERVEKVTKPNVKGMVYGEPKELLEDAAQFFTNILPAEVMSLEGAYQTLFARPDVEEKTM